MDCCWCYSMTTSYKWSISSIYRLCCNLGHVVTCYKWSTSCLVSHNPTGRLPNQVRYRSSAVLGGDGTVTEFNMQIFPVTPCCPTGDFPNTIWRGIWKVRETFDTSQSTRMSWSSVEMVTNVARAWEIWTWLETYSFSIRVVCDDVTFVTMRYGFHQQDQKETRGEISLSISQRLETKR